MRSLATLLAAALAVLGMGAGARAARLPGSPYPAPARGLNASSLLYVFNESALSADDLFTLQSLQGLFAREAPLIYRSGVAGNGASTWLNVLQTVHGVTPVAAPSVAAFLPKARGIAQGYVLANLGDASTTAAITYCSAVSAVAVTPANEAAAVAAGFSQLADVRNLDVAAVLALFNVSSFSDRIAVLQDPAKNGFLVDWGVFSGAITWWDSDMSSPLSTRVLNSLAPQSAVFGWGVSEDATVNAVSTVGSFVHASDFARNLATLASYEMPNLADLCPNNNVPSVSGIEPRKARSASERLAAPSSSSSSSTSSSSSSSPRPFTHPPQSNLHTVTFVMTDGDNVQWLDNDFTVNTDWWASPQRGQAHVGWTLSPALFEVAPAIAYQLFSTATVSENGSDTFIAAPSGLGYAYPDLMANSSVVQSFADLTNAYLGGLGLSIVNVMGEQYASEAAEVFLAEENVYGVFWYDYSSYSALNGSISISPATGYKPVVGGRYQLWDGVFENVTSLVEKLSWLPKNAFSSLGYSLIPVHVWTNTVADVVSAVNQLNALGGFQVVPPLEFVEIIRQYLGPCADAQQQPGARGLVSVTECAPKQA